MDNAMADYGPLMIAVREIWLEVSVVTDKQNWLKSSTFGTGDTSHISRGQVSMGYERRPTGAPILTPDAAHTCR